MAPIILEKMETAIAREQKQAIDGLFYVLGNQSKLKLGIWIASTQVFRDG